MRRVRQAGRARLVVIQRQQGSGIGVDNLMQGKTHFARVAAGRGRFQPREQATIDQRRTHLGRGFGLTRTHRVQRGRVEIERLWAKDGRTAKRSLWPIRQRGVTQLQDRAQ